jgi:hypothetical protein
MQGSNRSELSTCALSWRTFGVFKDFDHRIIREQGASGIASDGQMVLNVGDGQLEVERREMVAERQPLVEGLVGGERKVVTKSGWPISTSEPRAWLSM